MASPQAERIRKQLFPSREIAEVSVADWRLQMERLAASDVLPEGITISRCEIAGVSAEWIQSPAASANRTILYLHGGGYLLGSCATHRNLAARVAIAAGARALVPEYALAPERPYPFALRDAIAVHDAITSSGTPPSALALIGDSAGGGLAAALLLSLRDAGLAMPAAAVLLSPWTDLTLSGDSYRSRAKLDPLDREPALRRIVPQYVPDGEVMRPLASPLFADLRRLPPLLLQVGDHEVLLDDSVRLADRARAAGVDVTLQVWPEMWHGWQMSAPALPEANEAIERVGAYVRTRMSQKSKSRD